MQIKSTAKLSQLKARGVEENLFHLGLLLNSGITLSEALKELSDYSGNARIRLASLRAAGMLASGRAPEEVFAGNEMRVFTGFARYILAAPVSDKLKGQLLANWKRKSNRYIEIGKSLFYCVQSLLIGLFTCMTLFMFVLPQFKEIMYGLKVVYDPEKFNFALWFINFFGASDMSVLALAGMLIIAIVGLMIIVGSKFFKTAELIEEVNLFNLLVAVDYNHRLTALEVMAVSHNFPKSFNRLKTFATSLRQEGDVSIACQKASLNKFLCWFLQLAFTDNSDDRIITQGALLLETRYLCGIEKVTRLAEIFSVLGQGLVFGLIATVVFQLMNQILLGAIV